MKTIHHMYTVSVLSILVLFASCSQEPPLSDPDASLNGFPVGYYQFNKDKAFNFQLNRWISMGYVRYEDMREAGANINSFDDWKREMLGLAEQSLSENRMMNAAFYYRAAEFFTTAEDPDKSALHQQFSHYFYQAAEQEGMDQVEVPYGESFIQGMRLRPKQSDEKGTIVIHGGYDSFKEELYSMMKFFQQNGFEVITFDTPWMGRFSDQQEMGLDIAWEKLISAVLDYFKADDVTLIGISMGGWLSLRAAAFEPRIKRVIASSVSYDVNLYNNAIGRKIAGYMFEKKRDKLNQIMLKKMDKNLYYAWFVNHLMEVTNKETPVEAFDILMTFNAENLHSELVKQDVLILTGRNDHMVPFKMHRMQVKALTNAHSVSERIFTRDEHAQNHCQIGNIGLALQTMLDWIEQ
ncbi:MAG: alpha/beta hydrolase family protein [Bacteroidales bacterium]